MGSIPDGGGPRRGPQGSGRVSGLRRGPQGSGIKSSLVFGQSSTVLAIHVCTCTCIPVAVLYKVVKVKGSQGISDTLLLNV